MLFRSLILLGASFGVLAQSAQENVAYDLASADAELMPLSHKGLFTDVIRSGSFAIAVGERGHVLTSENFQNWKQVPVPTRSLLTAVAAIDADVWAVGHDGVILHSGNAGANWQRQRVEVEAEGPLLDVFFLDRQRGFAIGAYGQFLSTENGGETWNKELISDRVAAVTESTKMDAPEEDEDDLGVASDDMGEDEGDPHLNAMAKVGNSLLIVGEAGKSYRSLDEGKSWTMIRLPYEGSMFGLLTLDDGSGLAFGLRGNVLLTQDEGQSWSPLTSGTEQSFMGGAAVSGARAVLVGASGVVALRPSGESALRVLSYPDGGVLAGVLPKSDSDFVLVGENGIHTFKPGN
jgi:photosystem II stability/assembly factor-like uncharacterized protein